ncbi:thioesterase II family protein [Streptomyces sp. NBC_01481]|uniref:thioesterase II family protein n=1 Tax=Streptomyces sp. NBC_01481 TaxID=2975869 RepID=UPI002251F5E7|nr:alpha/beta fold hydrolase [Streptomyces sp. NBC_01481]MCX4587270.1 thioesterase domain-containing protein [Streptomyces sp. NBC_01481]
MTSIHATGGPVRTAAVPGEWFRVHRREDEPRLRLVCFPHAGGTTHLFHGWPAHLPPDIELLAVRYPGRHDRLVEPCMTDMAALATAVADALRAYDDRPLALFGHSMGASAAYEVALRLQARGTAVERLFVSAHASPHRARRRLLSHCDDATLIAEVRRLGEYGSEAYDIPELRELLLPALRADFRMLENYRPSRPTAVRVPITAYAGESDPGVCVEDVHSWAVLAPPGGFAWRTFPGDHFYLASEEASVVADVVGLLSPHPVRLEHRSSP